MSKYCIAMDRTQHIAKWFIERRRWFILSLTRILITSILLSAVILSQATSFAAEQTQSFSDVSPGSWYYEAVMKQTTAGIFLGFEDGTFRPDEDITCGQFMTLLCRITDTDICKNTQTGEWATHWAADSIWTAYKNNWISGSEFETISANPNAPILRKLSIKTLLCALGKSDNLNSYEDYIDKAFELGIMHGNENGDPMAESSTTRAQVAQLLCRVTDLNKKENTPKENGCPYCSRTDHLSDIYCAAKAVDTGAAGRWSIPAYNVNVAIYNGWEQEITDKKDSANYFRYGSQYLIADHVHQGFSGIKKCTVGDIAYLDTGDSVQQYVCTGIIIGYNTGKNLTDENGNILSDVNPGGITCYTCNPLTKSVTIVYFQPVAETCN